MNQLLIIVLMIIGYSTADEISDLKRRVSKLESINRANVHFYPANTSRIHTSDPFTHTYNFWDFSPGTNESSIRRTYHLNRQSGLVTIKKSGTYLIYAQMVYHGLSGRWSYGIYVDGTIKQKCLSTEQLTNINSYHPLNHGVYKLCSTIKIHNINAQSTVSVRCLYGTRNILTDDAFTYWGIISLS